MSIRAQILLILWLLVLMICSVFAYYQFQTQVQQYMWGVDKQLYASARMAKALLTPTYHDQITGPKSISDEQYRNIIDRYNKLCVDLGLQYLWSNKLVDGKIVFTSSTSTSKDVSNGDHAWFYDVHRDPAAFGSVFQHQKTTYSTFTNEWGKGRMVLIPDIDSHGHPYVFGASISINDLENHKLLVAKRVAMVFTVAIIASHLLGFFLANRLTAGIRQLTDFSVKIGEGNYGNKVNVGNANREVKQLANCINDMSQAVHEKDQALATSLQQRTDALDASENRLARIIAHSAEGIISVDHNGRIQVCNVAARQILGTTEADLTGKSITDLISGYEKHIADMAKSGSPLIKGELTRQDGALIPIRMNISKVALEGGKEETIILIEDNSAQQAHEDKLRSARQQAEVANEAKSRFLASMSHELRTPLNSVLGFSQLLTMNHDKPLTPQQDLAIQQINQSGRLLLHLIDAVLDLSKIEAKEVSLNLQYTSLKSLVEDCLCNIQIEADKKQIRLVKSQCKDFTINVDPVRTKQVILNLLTNAVKYNKQGGEILIGSDEINGNTIRFFVQDTGPGIPEELLPQLFQPFNRLGKEASDVPGSGIGLTIAKRLMESMGGEIGVNNNYPAGAEFWITLPKATAINHSNIETDQPIKLDADALRGTVLCLEDDDAHIRLMESIFSILPHAQLVMARNLSEARQKLQQAKTDLILLDVHLPRGESGLDFALELRDSEQYKNIPIIVVSAGTLKSDAKVFQTLGIEDVILKPFSIAEFVEIMGKYI